MGRTSHLRQPVVQKELALHAGELLTIWRPSRELAGERSEVQAVLQLKGSLADTMLLSMVKRTEA